ncbi:MAG TPA: hypothetical protein VGI28_03755, partial [Stellaceae bacterium]
GSRIRVFPEAARIRGGFRISGTPVIRMSPRVERPPTPEVLHDPIGPKYATNRCATTQMRDDPDARRRRAEDL